MAQHYDSVYLSPHPDDVVFSCAGRIWLQTDKGASVRILTVTTGDPEGPLSPFARRLHARCGLEPTSLEIRRREDLEAAEILGVEVLHLDLQDAIYRMDPDTDKARYQRFRHLFGPLHPADGEFSLELTARLRELLSDCREVVVPLGVGDHVDHRLVREAAELSTSTPLLYYEEFPYVEKSRALDRVLQPSSDWEPEVVALPPEAVKAKQSATLAYSSQIDLIFGSSQRLQRALRRRHRHVGGERYWRKKDSLRPGPGPA
jgi:LmbE family N-acetylglucosaminyl deacetylase